jgi:hypothetical protein
VSQPNNSATTVEQNFESEESSMMRSEDILKFDSDDKGMEGKGV